MFQCIVGNDKQNKSYSLHIALHVIFFPPLPFLLFIVENHMKMPLAHAKEILTTGDITVGTDSSCLFE